MFVGYELMNEYVQVWPTARIGMYSDIDEADDATYNFHL